MGNAFALVKTLASLKMIALSVVAAGALWAVRDVLGTYQDAAVLDERNRYLLDLHAERDRSEAIIADARDAAVERNAELQAAIDETRVEIIASPPTTADEIDICPAECLLQPR